MGIVGAWRDVCRGNGRSMFRRVANANYGQIILAARCDRDWKLTVCACVCVFCVTIKGYARPERKGGHKAKISREERDILDGRNGM